MTNAPSGGQSILLPPSERTRPTSNSTNEGRPSRLACGPLPFPAMTETVEVDMLTELDPDHELLTALRQREPTAAEALLTVYGDRAYRLAARITGNQQDAEEAVQDAFWSVVSKIDTFRGDSAFRSWVYRIVSNAAYDKIQRRPQAFVDISLEEVSPVFDQDGRHTGGVIRDWSPSIDDPAVQSELRTVLSSAVSELPAHYRAVIVLRDVEGLSMAEVADALGITIPTAKTRAHRARLFLRKRLSIFMAGSDPPPQPNKTKRLDQTAGGRGQGLYPRHGVDVAVVQMVDGKIVRQAVEAVNL